MNIRLATSPHVRHPAVLQADFQPDPSVMITFIPIGLLSLIAAVRRNLRLQPELFDWNRLIVEGEIAPDAKFYETSAESLCKGSPDVIGLMTESESYHHVLQVCDTIKKILPQCLLVLGGPHASAVAFRTLEKHRSVDCIVQGEGESTFVELLATCLHGGGRPVPGSVGRDRDGAVISGGTRPQVPSLDSLDPPPYELYRPDAGEEIFLEVGRGCPFQCTFCSTAPFWKRQHRVKSPGRILQEIAEVRRLYGPRRVHFTHDLFTANQAWVREVCAALIRAGTPVRWTCSSRTDTVDEELLDLMARAGCDAIYFGLESGSARILKEIHKDIPVEHSFRILQACRDAGITPNAGFIGGLPSEDEASFTHTFDAFTQALRLGCSPVHIFLYTPYADSLMFRSFGETICTQHFLDLPLGPELDGKNRALIASDRILYGAFHRPLHDSLGEELFDALEEFPTLVASVLLPTLFEARNAGGMFALFKAWISWIGRINDERRAATFRRYYGSPVQFCDFLLEYASARADSPVHLRSLLRVLRMNHLLAGSTRIATTMANYRSQLASNEVRIVGLQSELSLGGVLGFLGVEHDISPAFSALPGGDLPAPNPGPLFLVWQRDDSGFVRLLQLDEFRFRAVQLLNEKPRMAAEIIADWVVAPGGTGPADFHQLLGSLGTAIESGIITQTGIR